MYKFSKNDEEIEDSKELIKNRLNYLKSLVENSIEEEGRVSQSTQNAIVSSLESFENISDFPDDFTSEDIENSFNQLQDILANMDDETILDTSIIRDKNFGHFLLYLKNGRDFHVEVENEESKILLKSGENTLNNLNNHKIYFDIIEIKNGALYFSGSFVSLCDNDALSIEAIKTLRKGEKEIYEGEFVEYPTTKRATVKYLGIPWKHYYNFDFVIPVESDENSKVDFHMIYEENGKKIMMKNRIGFRSHANLSHISSYFIKESLIVSFRLKTFYVLPYSYTKVLELELKTFARILKTREKNFLNALLFRLMILILIPFMKGKRIWLFQDRPDVADDNAKHLFSYSTKQEDGVEKYYILERGCDDYEEMLKIDKNIVDFHSLKHEILYCFAEKVISSHSNQEWLNPFFHKNLKLYSGAITVQKCFLQHGVTKDDVSHWFRKYYHNFYLLLTTSDLERDSMLSKNYNYPSEVVQSLGFPRFDNLNNDDLKKQILFMPTWRKTIETKEDLIDSDFYKSINGFFKDEELMNLARENDYKILFKPHWNLIPFLDSFDIGEDVEIVEDVPYQRLFNESALLITDYSSVAFDFAYLKKPVIYLQETEYHYAGGYYKYETMGFGDIAKSEEELVQAVIKQINNNCQMEEKYKQRVDGFFKFTDKNNCKRNYEWLLKNK